MFLLDQEDNKSIASGLCFKYSFLFCLCWITTTQCTFRICSESVLMLLQLMCVWERRGECRTGTWPDFPLFWKYHAKVLLIRLIKCFVGTGPTLHAINTSSCFTPTPPLCSFNFHTFSRDIFLFFYHDIRAATFSLFLIPAVVYLHTTKHYCLVSACLILW